MDKENYRKVVKICEKGRCKVRENSFGVCWCVRCGKLHSDAAEKLMLEFAKFNIKPSDVLGKTVIFECKSISAYE